MNEEKVRTNQQSKALHLFFDQLADVLNDQGMYIGQTIRVDAEWSGERIKELIWREVMIATTGKKTTTKLTTKEINKILDSISLAFANKGIEVPMFPSIEAMAMGERINDK